jgi:hypothetical protein
MKNALVAAGLLCAAAALAWYEVQPPAPQPPLAQLLPGGALVSVEAKDLSRLLDGWNASREKTAWLKGANFAEFSRSNLFLKLKGVFDEYAAAAGFAPDMKALESMAGAESAIALYDLHDVRFAYVTRLSEQQALASRLGRLRSKFETREASGFPFYMRVDRASSRVVAFAVARGCLFVSTDEDLLAGMLGLLAGKDAPSVASQAWYRDPVNAASRQAGDLRMVMNLESLASSTYFRSYWVQRNASYVHRFLSGVADLDLSLGEVREHRLLLCRPGADLGTPASDAVAAAAELTRLAPDDAGLYRAWAAPGGPDAVTLLRTRILDPYPAGETEPVAAPSYAEPAAAGSEADLETRIDEPPLPDTSQADPDMTAVASEFRRAGVLATLQVESGTVAPNAVFVQFPVALAFLSREPWQTETLRAAFGNAASALWSTSVPGVSWAMQAHNGHPVYTVEGPGGLAFSTDGRLLLVANDPDLLAAMLDRTTMQSPPANSSYVAVFRHARERAGFTRMMSALDFAAGRAGDAPPFFSANIQSLSDALSSVAAVQINERENSEQVEQTLLYSIKAR